MAMTDRRGGAVMLPGDARTAWGVDFSRVVHSSSFRRLQGKTQILAIGDGDFHRTRLTHSLETAQVAEGIVERLAVDTDGLKIGLPPSQLIRTVALCHDLGHPPFGHSGEIALNKCMAEHGGFEGNGQTLRILARLEHYSNSHGADLTRRTLLGILKYPISYSAALRECAMIVGEPIKPPKCYLDTEEEVVDWLLADFTASDATRFTELANVSHGFKTIHSTLDCSIMEIADDIAYGVHDLEDAIALDLIPVERFRDLIDREVLRHFLAWMEKTGAWRDGCLGQFSTDLFGTERARKQSIGRIVHYLIAAVALKPLDGFEHPLLRVRATLHEDARHLLNGLQSLVASDVILRPSVQQLEFKGRRVVDAVFEAYRSDPLRLLPKTARIAFDASGGDLRVLCDHIASLTDQGIVRSYERLFVTRSGSAFDTI